MEGNQHHGTFIFHNVKDPFLKEENVQEESFQLFKLISSIIRSWARWKHDPSLSCMDYDEYLRGRSRSWYQTLPQAEFVYNSTIHSSKDTQEEVQWKIEKINMKYKTTADKKRQEKFFNKEVMTMMNLRRDRIPTKRVPTEQLNPYWNSRMGSFWRERETDVEENQGSGPILSLSYQQQNQLATAQFCCR